MVIYVIGSLENPRIPDVGNTLREEGYDAFDDWFAGGKDADRAWMEYEKRRGRTYGEALQAYNAKHIFEYDLFHLDRADAGVLVYPAGRSAHLELGYLMWKRNKPGYILCEEEPPKWDVMTQFVTAMCFSMSELLGMLKVQQQVQEYRRAPWNADL